MARKLTGLGKGRPVADSRLRTLRAGFPDLPPAYWDFLVEIGCGELGGLMFYGGPTTLAALGLVGPTDFVAIGDDFSGTWFGFCPVRDSASVFELDSHHIDELLNTKLNFEAFVARIATDASKSGIGEVHEEDYRDDDDCNEDDRNEDDHNEDDHNGGNDEGDA